MSLTRAEGAPVPPDWARYGAWGEQFGAEVVED